MFAPHAPRRLYNDTAREARSNPGEIPNRRTGNAKRHLKIAPGFRTGKNEPAAAHSELKHRGSHRACDEPTAATTRCIVVGGGSRWTIVKNLRLSPEQKSA